MPREGRDLERLVASLEVSVIQHGAKVESPGTVVDLTNDQPREFDVLIRQPTGHHEVLVAFEARDRKRPVGGPDVEAFYGKCRDCGIGGIYMVSSSGFSAPARKKAERYGIKCLSIEQAKSLEWMKATLSIAAQVIGEALHVGFRLQPDSDAEAAQPSPELTPATIAIEDRYGPVDVDDLLKVHKHVAMEKLRTRSERPPKNEPYSGTVRIEDEMWLVLPSGERKRLVALTVVWQMMAVPLEAYHVRYRSDDGMLSEATVTERHPALNHARVLVISSPSRPNHLHVVLDAPATKKPKR